VPHRYVVNLILLEPFCVSHFRLIHGMSTLCEAYGQNLLIFQPDGSSFSVLFF